MTRKIRKIETWRGYACVLATALLLAGCSSDLIGPETGTGTTGAPRVDEVDDDLQLRSEKPLIRRCYARGDEIHKVCTPEIVVSR